MANSERPLVSICIPTHDDAGVVADALRSAMRQDYAPLEIVVLDNHSGDRTTSVVLDTAGADSRVRVICHSENVGMSRNFSACVSEAAGEFLLILCADDLLDGRCVTELAGQLRNHPEAVIAACGRTFADRQLRPISVRRARVEKAVVDGAELIRECFVRGNRIGEPSAVMFRRAAATRGFDPEYNQAVDLEMWFHLLEKGSAVLLPEPLCIIRQHGEQATQRNLRSGRVVADKRRLFRRFAPRLSAKLSAVEKLVWDARMASSLSRSGHAVDRTEMSGVDAVFYPSLYLKLVGPLVSVGWKVREAMSA